MAFRYEILDGEGRIWLVPTTRNARFPVFNEKKMFKPRWTGGRHVPEGFKVCRDTKERPK